MSNFKKTTLKTLLLTTLLYSGTTAFAQDAQAPVEDEVVATGVFIPNEKRITSEITSVLDEEAFETIGAGDIADALTRVTGLSLSQGKFVVVRGLNERYSSATLNGSPLPSPEPLRRVAPLDLFPTSVLSDVVVSKTFSPEFSGEFGGGSINLKTKSLPNESFLDVSLSSSFNTATTLDEGLVYEGSGTDWIGFDNGLRDLPALDADGVPTENFENFNTLIIDTNNQIPFNGGGRISVGNRYDLDSGKSIGVLATLGYDNSWETREGEDNNTAIGSDGLEVLDSGTRRSTENKISLNGMLSVGVELNENNEIQIVGLATRQSSAEARTLSGFDREGRIFRQDFTEWFEREVYMGQLLGEHYIPSLNDMEVSWRAAYAEAGRDAPYERQVNYEDYEDGRGLRYQFNRTNNAFVNFSELDDTTLDFGLDFVLPLDFLGQSAELKFGGAYLDKSRDSSQADYRYAGTLPDELRDSRVDVILSDEVIEAGLLEIRRGGTTGFPDVSAAGLEVFAAYTGLDVELNESLRFALGVRFEDSTQETQIEQSTVADSLFVFDPPLEDSFILPAATLTYTFADNLQLRLAASKTVNRPQFRELTPTIFVNTDTDDRFVGNPFLVNSESTNLDARLEYYFSASQFFTVGAFYKDLTNPIEEFLFNGIGESNATSFLNAPSAELFGIEAEFEKKWDMAELGMEEGFLGETVLVFRSNYTFTDSSVSADGEVSITPPTVNPSQGVSPLVLQASSFYTDGRNLQGQSDHLANLQIGLENFDKTWEGTLLLNYSSERIRTVEDLSNGLPSIFEQLPLSLDFVFNYDFELRGGAYEVGFKVQNILNEGYEAYQELDDTRIVLQDYDIGTTFAASLKRRF